jgi:hypothetical protein
MSSKKYKVRVLDGIRKHRVKPEVESQVILKYLEALDCPRALTVAMLFREGEHLQLSELAFNPLHYESFEETRGAYLATKFLSKFSGLSTGLDLDEVAIAKFVEFELCCKRTNARFRNLSADPLYRGNAVRLHQAVVRKIDRILGEFSCSEFLEEPDWGPGATTLIKRQLASPINKFQCETGITRDLYQLLPLGLLSTIFPLWGSHLSGLEFPLFQVGNKVTTVPKDATTNRVIAIEPGLNLFFQKSVGEMIGKRLQRCGIDLRDQSRNQFLARRGSIDSQLATIDMRSASDSISRLVVEELFNEQFSRRWLSVMDSCRSHYGSLKQTLVRWEKFSSMGNGFTFQLESLIFYAIALCCVEDLGIKGSVSVYGDDIIIPVQALEMFSEMMSFYGFQINWKKTHSESPFRESCGAHWYSGRDLKPVYLRDRLSSVQSCYKLANAVRRLAHRQNASFGCDARFQSTFELLVQKTPQALRLRVPEGFGDGGFIGNFDEATPSRLRDQHEGVGFWTLIDVPKKYKEERVGYLLASLWRLQKRRSSTEDFPSRLVRQILTKTSRFEPVALLKAIDELSPSGKVPHEEYNSVPLVGSTKMRLVYSRVQQWYDLGPWI